MGRFSNSDGAKGEQVVRVLLIGHLSSRASGSSLSFTLLVEELAGIQGVKTVVVNTARDANETLNVWRNLGLAWRVACKMISARRRIDVVSFHASSPAMSLFSPVVFVLSKALRKPVVLRVFGGSFDAVLNARSNLTRAVLRRTAFRAERWLFQTRHLVAFGREQGIRNPCWFSTSRRLPDISTFRYTECARKFIFLGRVTEDKGVGILLEAAMRIAADVEIDVYGPLMPPFSEDAKCWSLSRKVTYKGLLPHTEVMEVLREYDVLMLPTWYSGEGYPGAIVEAFSCGLPVIATNWMAIPEIVTNETGVLIPIASVHSLAKAIDDLARDRILFQTLRANAWSQRERFCAKKWAHEFVRQCRDLAFSS